MIKLISKVNTDKFTEHASKCFDYKFTGESITEIPSLPEIPKEFNIGLIYGSSGSGKSTILRESFGYELVDPMWSYDKAIISHFNNPEEAVEKLTAVGLNSIPQWMKPYQALSNGEKFRADLAITIGNGAIVDEYTSVVNRECAKSASVALSKYIRRKNIKNVILASCHKDIIEWLEPDWTYDTDSHQLSVGRLLWRKPTIKLEIFPCKWTKWEAFKRHHYLSADLNVSSRCFIGVWDGIEVAFNASLSLPGRIPPLYSGDTRNKYRESRTVVLPDYQGIGLGVRFSDAIGQIFLDEGYRYFSKTAHIRMGDYRTRVDWWRQTSTNLKSREKSQCRSKNEAWHHYQLDTKRLCYSHEYIGKRGNKYRELYESEKNK